MDFGALPPEVNRGAICQEQRLAHQGIEQIENGIVVGVAKSCYRAGALQVKSPGEHRIPLQQRPFRIVEVVVGPCHRVAQGLVA